VGTKLREEENYKCTEVYCGDSKCGLRNRRLF
jgi:hypothetical protein